MKKRGIILTIIIIVLAFAIATYFVFFYSTNCGSDENCWKTKLETCSKARFTNDAGEIIWEYKILRKQNDDCLVNVKVLRIVDGLQKTRILEGKSMKCSLPFGAYTVPERDVTLCHGLLKEEIQTLMIDKLHQYVLENIGEISDELSSPITSE